MESSFYDSFPEYRGYEFYIRSKLVYPLDYYFAGLKITSGKDSGRGLLFSLTAGGSFDDPEEEMTDDDWIGYKPSDSYLVWQKIQSTESESEFKMFSVSAETSLRGVTFLGFPVLAGLSFDFNAMWWDIYGFKGYAYDEMGNEVFGYMSSSKNVLDYNISIFRSLFFFEWTLLDEGKVFFDLEGGIVPFSAAVDRDDHILRKKESEVLSTGWGWKAGGALTVEVLPKWSLGGSVEMERLFLSGDMTQTYYGDDPGFTGDETGTVYGGILTELVYSNIFFEIKFNRSIR
ncbi:MAG: hypothetical protein ACLFQK_10945 [Fibrobacterota bacterium]